MSALLQTVSAISGVMVTHFFFFFRLVEQLVSRLTAGDLADLPCVCPGEGSVSGELLDMFWLEMTLTRDTKRRGRSKENGTGVRGISVNLIPRCLDVLKFIVTARSVPRVSACCLLKATVLS